MPDMIEVPDDWEFADDGESYGPSYLDSAQRGLTNTSAFLLDTFAGGLGIGGQALSKASDYLGGDSLQQVGQLLQDYSVAEANNANAARQQAMQEYGDGVEANGLIPMLIENAGPMAASLLPAMRMKNIAGAAYMGATAIPNLYQKYLGEGEAPEDALAPAFTGGAIEGLTGAIALPGMTSPTLGKLARTGISAAFNAGQNVGADLGTMKAEELMLDRDYTSDDYLNRAGTQAALGAGMGALAGYGMHKGITRRSAEADLGDVSFADAPRAPIAEAQKLLERGAILSDGPVLRDETQFINQPMDIIDPVIQRPDLETIDAQFSPVPEGLPSSEMPKRIEHNTILSDGPISTATRFEELLSKDESQVVTKPKVIQLGESEGAFPKPIGSKVQEALPTQKAPEPIDIPREPTPEELTPTYDLSDAPTVDPMLADIPTSIDDFDTPYVDPEELRATPVATTTTSKVPDATAKPKMLSDYLEEAGVVKDKHTRTFMERLTDETGSAPMISDGGFYVSQKAKQFGEDVKKIFSSDIGGTKVETPDIDKNFGGGIFDPIKKTYKAFSTLDQIDRQWGSDDIKGKGGRSGKAIRVANNAAKGMNTTRANILFDSAKRMEVLSDLTDTGRVKVDKITKEIRRESNARIKRGQEQMAILDEDVASGKIEQHNADMIRNQIIRDASLDVSPELLMSKGLSDVEAKAVTTIFDWTNTDALEYIRAGKLWRSNMSPKAIENINTAIKGLREWNGVKRYYVPFSRWGDQFLHVVGEKGETAAFKLGDKKAIQDAIKAYKEQGYTDKQLMYGELRKTVPEAYENLPPEAAFSLAAQNNDDEFLNQFTNGGKQKVDLVGFKKHLASADLVAGEGEDLSKAMTDYIYSLSNYVAKGQFKKGMAEALATADNKSPVYSWLSKYQEKLLYDQGWGNKVNRINSLIYLGGRASSAVTNLTQPLTTTAAKVGFTTAGKALKMAGSYAMDKKAFERANPELASFLYRLKRDGVLDANVFGEWEQAKFRKLDKLNTISDGAMYMFTKAEEFNRFHAAIAGYLDAQTKKIPAKGKYQYVEDTVNRTQFDNNKSGRSLYAMGGKTFGDNAAQASWLFRSFGQNYYRFLKNEWNDGNKMAVARSMSIMLAAAGLRGIPGVREIMYGAQLAGADPNKDIREFIGNNDDADMLLYGLPTAIGVNLSGAMGTANFLPDLTQKDPAEALLGFAGGIPYDMLVNKPKRVMQLLGEGAPIIPTAANPRSALEPLLPEAARRVVQAGRRGYEGLRNPDGTPVGIKPGESGPYMPTAGEVIKDALGFNNPEYNRRYEAQGTVRNMLDRRKSLAGINKRVAEMIYDIEHGTATREDLSALVAEYRDSISELPSEYRVPINWDTVKSIKKTMYKGPEKTIPKSMRRVIKETQEVYSEE